ncbi:30S ribosomal protein S15 [Candidatus Annandia adelgestsuga]|uniref:Small ribosomal subunit protein uS15 n=1 Tax=Candidatus Annandia adelgestsuga TaxID=1302411 RepID=A0A3Q9CLR1_9ENTR|nr:30S ribosomal protein S15 [Candidatus Annandia adelgestsuga]AZP36307.1 30S ribosomal protein S15 [Candidatus Annandia adelgestsuga]
MNIYKKKNFEIIKKYGNDKNDSGSTKVQIVIFTNYIKHLHKHFLIHKKDFHSKTGLLKIVSKRKKMLNYFKKKNLNDYINLIKKLKIRK